ESVSCLERYGGRRNAASCLLKITAVAAGAHHGTWDGRWAGHEIRRHSPTRPASNATAIAGVARFAAAADRARHAGRPILIWYHSQLPKPPLVARPVGLSSGDKESDR